MGFYFLLPQDSTDRATGTGRRATSIETLHRLECKACPLNEIKGLQHPKMEATGVKRPLVYMLGEAPGGEEDEKGVQFIGVSGQVIRELVPSKLRKKLRWNNCVRTRPPKNRNPTRMELECCRPSIVRDIERSKPKAIFGFGGISLSWATGEDGIYKWRGRRVPLKVGSHVCWFFPMLHPAGLIRQRKRGRYGGRMIKSEAEKTFVRDLKRAFREVRSLPDAQISSPYKNSDVIPSPTGGGLIVPDLQDPRKTFVGIDYVTGSEGEKDLRRVRQWLLKMAASPTVAFDFETSSKERTKERQTRPYGEGSQIISVAVASRSRSLAFPLHHPEAKWTPKQLVRLERLVHEFLVVAKGVKIAHNLAFELEWACYFYDLDLVYAGIWGDTMAQAYVLDERKGMLSLDSLTVQHFGFSLKDLIRLNIGGLDSEPLPLVLAYNALDALYANKLFHHQRSLLKSDGLLDVYKMHVKPIPATVVKRLFGNRIDFDRVLAFDEKYSAELEKLRRWIDSSKSAKRFKDHTGSDFNPSSSSDVITMFKDVLNRKEGWREDRDKKKRYSVDDEVLVRIGSIFARKIQAWRAVTGNKAKYVDPIHPETGKCIFPDKRTHATVNLFFTDTGRTSCSFPNEQYWPKRNELYRDLRSVFVANDDCYMVAIDQGQIEARVIQMAARDRQYGEYLWDRHDIHMDWTERLAYAYPRRVGGKKFLKDKEALGRFRYDVKNQWTFPLFFGAVAPSVANYLGMPLDVVGPLVDDFWEEFSGIKEWQEELETFYDRYGYVSCLTGRRRRAPISINELINSPIQGTASDITVDAFSRLSYAAWEMDMWQFQARLEIHDELVFPIPKKTFDRDVEFICDYLLDCEHFDFINVPLCVEVSRGPNWFEQESVMTLFSDDFGKIDRKACGF